MNTPAYEPCVFTLPFPEHFDDEALPPLEERFNAMCGAAEQIHALATNSGQTIVIPQDAQVKARNIFTGGEGIPGSMTTAEQLHLTALLQAYDMPIVQSAQQIRNFCTNLLIQKAGAGSSDQVQLRAVEMLGKIADVALFEERSTILVTSMTTDDIKKGLREKINRMRSTASAVTTDVSFKETS